MPAVARGVQPQHRTRRMRRRQGVQHRKDGRHPDSGADERHGPLAGLQEERPARRADFEKIPHPHVVSHIGTPYAVRFDLHADPIAIRRGRSRKRVAAKERRVADARSKAQHDILAGQCFWQRLVVEPLHCQRHDIGRFLVNRRQLQRPESRRPPMSAAGWPPSARQRAASGPTRRHTTARPVRRSALHAAPPAIARESARLCQGFCRAPSG